jgi:hypothetical protein
MGFALKGLSPRPKSQLVFLSEDMVIMEIIIFQGFRHLFCQKMQPRAALPPYGELFGGEPSAIANGCGRFRSFN